MRNKYNKVSIIIKTTSAIVILAIVFYAGTFVGQAELEPHANAKLNAGFNPTVEARLVETKTIQYVETPAIMLHNVEPVKIIEQVKDIHTELRSFRDLQELKQWLENWKNVTAFSFQYPDTSVDCDDFALALQRNALEDGYLMSFQIIEPDKYNSLFQDGKIPVDTLHALNLTVIGNSAYLIEPQTGEIVLGSQLD